LIQGKDDHVHRKDTSLPATGARQKPLLTSWLVFGLSLVVIGFVVWSRFFSTPVRGEWRPHLVGTMVGALPIVDLDGHEVQLTHPAAIYFYSQECRFCPPATERLNHYVARYGTPDLSIYALGGIGRPDMDPGVAFGEAIQMVRLTRTVPSLRFVNEVPLLIRTDAYGAIRRAYVGVAADRILADILAPREAGSAAP
jgi:hypothetical protein